MILKYYGGWQNRVSLYQNTIQQQKKTQKRVNWLLMKVRNSKLFKIEITKMYKCVCVLGLKWAKHALEMYPGNCNAHKWFAICSGARGQLGSTKEKIEGGYIFQNHINEAIKINSRDPTLYYLKGKLEYEVKFI